MELSSVGAAPKLAVTTTPLKSTQSDTKIAFGIGQDKNVELSAQGKILQQTEQAQNQRANSLAAASKTPDEQAGDERRSDYVRVSSSVGTAQKNNLSSEQATEVYRSIEKLL